VSSVVDRLTPAISDRYRIERELGAGGMATVFLGHDLRHDRDVAVKVLHPDLGAALGSERFLAEIFFWEGTRLMSATLARESGLRVVSGRPLFEGSFELDFDVAKDGNRFLAIELETTGLGLAVIPNWRTELRRATASEEPVG
jgi:hypothetical protein